MKFTILASLAASAAAFVPANTGRAATHISETKEDLEVLAKKLNPVVGFWDPFELSENYLWLQEKDFTIGWLRQAEIKHSRVAMAAFVGYCVQSNFHFPWPQQLDGTSFPSTDLSPPEQWDAMPFAAKLQIVLFVGFLEIWSEMSGETHYTQGGTPGKFPTFDGVPHPVPFNLYDPLNFHKNMTAEQSEKGLITEINNGRLAMIGIFGFLAAQTVPGSVPALAGIVKPYSGEVMAPFSGDFTLF